jgi:GR25 family glycosyltransferase involved in LPS biosynthesis
MKKTLLDFPIYYINLSRDFEKKTLLEAQLKNSNGLVTRVEGIDGKSVENELREKGLFKNSKKHAWDSEEMTAGEMGCLLSHLKIFESTVDENSDDYILVVEDDANFSLWKNTVAENFVLETYILHDCIQLSFTMAKHNLDYIDKKCNEISIPYYEDWNQRVKENHPWGFAWTTTCYLVSKDARRRVLDRFNNSATQGFLRPADFYIYETLQTVTLVPPIVSQHNFTIMKSSIQSCVDHHLVSNNFVTNKFYKKKLVLVSIYFGKIPEYFYLFLDTIKDKDFDFVFVTDQVLDRKTLPINFNYIFMTLSDLNQNVSELLGEDVKLKGFYKLVDLKPLFGSIVKLYIDLKYEYWAWSDIDMLFGDVTSYLNTKPGYDVYSFGKSTFGPLTIFSVEKYIDIYKHIPRYADILNNPSICKIDEMWFFDQFQDLVEGKIYYDINQPIYYDSRCKSLQNVVEDKRITSLFVFEWRNKDCGILWDMKEKILKGERSWVWKYEIKNGKLYFQNNEIAFSHMTILKKYKAIVDVLKLCKPLSCFQLCFQVNVKEQFLADQEIYSYNVYEIYNKFIDFEIKIKV